jgi:predicted chitinase
LRDDPYEIFAGDTFPAFLAKSRAFASQPNLPDSYKTMRIVPKGTALIADAKQADTNVAANLVMKPTGVTDSFWVKVQPYTVGTVPAGHHGSPPLTKSGSEVWVAGSDVSKTTGVPAWSQFPLQGGAAGQSTALDRVYTTTELSKLGHATDDQGVHWYEVVTLGPNNQSIHGWVSEAKLTKLSPFAWPGFEIVDATAITPKDAFQRQMVQQGTLLSGEAAQFKPAAEVVNNSALMDALDKAMDTDHNGNLDTQKLRAAMLRPDIAQGISHIIGKYESEWGGDMGRWNDLTSLMKDGAPRWQKELERIQKLQIWADLASVDGGKFPGATVHHFHPIGIIENFFQGCTCSDEITREQLIACAAGHQGAASYLDALNKAFKDYNIKKCINRAHFIAQSMIESANYQVTKEVVGKKLPDYWPYIGRGIMQLTGQGNYEAYGSYAGEDFISDNAAMAKLEGPPHAMLSAAWYYTNAGVSPYGDLDDFIMVTMKINGGFNGYDARLKRLNDILGILHIKDCAKNNVDGSYEFEKSAAYNTKRGAFAWGLWHDPDSTQDGTDKDKAESLKGYQRYVDLDTAAGSPKDKDGTGKDKGWYRIGKKKEVLEYSKERISALKGG